MEFEKEKMLLRLANIFDDVAVNAQKAAPILHAALKAIMRSEGGALSDLAKETHSCIAAQDEESERLNNSAFFDEENSL